MTIQAERHLFTFVALGSFNPAIFHPIWFETNDLIPKNGWVPEDIEVCSKQISVISMDDLRVEVTSDRLAMMTQKPSLSPALRDLAVGTLTVLEHSPLTAVGMNLHMHYRMPSPESHQDVGNRLVPKSDWSFLESPGLLQLRVQGKRTSTKSDRLEFSIGPSDEIMYGVVITANQHYNLEKSADLRGRNLECRRILQDDWAEFLRYTTESASKLLEPSLSKS